MNLLTVIIVAIAAFLAVTLILVALLLFAKAKLTTSGDVTININDGQKMLTVAGGSSLLNTLTSQGIFLPSACGGKGACGQCKCQVLEGGGDILPTETGFFNRKQIQDHWRLGCQVKVKENMKIAVPASVLSIKKWECEVVSNHNVATFIKEFVVKLPEGEDLNFRSGGYIQIDVPPVTVDFKNIDVDPEYREDWEKMHIFDLKMVNTEPQVRAYSCATYPAEGNVIKLNVRIATPPFDRATGRFMNVNPGVCSSYIYSLKPGDKITISGPYGEFFLPDNLPDDQELIFIGGGAGMAPMRSHLMHLFKTEKTKRPVSFWYGARSLKEAFYLEDFHEIEKEFPGLDCGSCGAPTCQTLAEDIVRGDAAPNDCIYVLRSNIADLSHKIEHLTDGKSAGEPLTEDEDRLLHRYIHELTTELASFGVPGKSGKKGV